MSMRRSTLVQAVSSFGLASLLLLGPSGASSAQERAIIRVAAGNGVYPGYQQPDAIRKGANRYPGYAASKAKAGPAAEREAAPRRTMGGLFGYLANRERAVVATPIQPALAARPQRSAGLLARPARPAAKAARSQAFDPAFLPQDVAYSGGEKPGTIVIDTNGRFLYLVAEGGTARRYGVGVGKPGFEWAGRHRVTRKSEWPTWTPPSQMRERERMKGRILPVRMDGGPDNPLGARAMYLGSTLYRIHGTNQPWSIGKAVSSGCIRMRNEDVMDLYERVAVGTDVIVL